MLNLYEDYDEINAELRAMAEIAAVEATSDVKRIYVGGGEILPVNLERHVGDHGITFFTENSEG